MEAIIGNNGVFSCDMAAKTIYAVIMSVLIAFGLYTAEKQIHTVTHTTSVQMFNDTINGCW